ncbi:hypothetical protein WEV50_004263 [Salmonella enterica]|uniref:Uncharacterized protein n=1 Tax=Salmonella enterica subsp. houtenae serovar 21:z4,z23:- TaxID=1967606 RepID=A0A752IVS9_SALHO|nr:hypothetical protein [Salmonella enterica]ECJ2489313.1 hypothetical protein [Salmonella enterica subsp. houtenae]EDS0027843.1 hypothetical protein [Salmonella enterica subsp. enterica serovar Carswell]EIN8557949.1 hypothetical protein [Salmonella enterica subsp. houtenae serovar 48:g,z51:-]HAF7513472.1 hypothetical protein [Salmonella enterica subsp. houtenae serovar 21:z4,z23:-]HCM1983233.1 hypothetical protein [Salmonella enterica subsp. houtenae serovar 41:z36:-]
MISSESDITQQSRSLTDIVRYRVEQEVSIRLNRIPVNNTIVKTDYTVKHNYNEPLFYSVHVDDHISKISPNAHQDLLDIMKSVDIIKSNVDLLINASTGKPETIKNHDVIINKWNIFKENFLKENEFIRAKVTRQNIQDFVSVFDEQINSCEQLLIGLDSQIFFNTFFDYFLVNMQTFESNLTMNYHSQLFKGIVTPLIVNQKILRETSEKVLIRKMSTSVSESNINIGEIKKQYNERYKPIIDYQFSEYQVNYDAQIEFNTIEKNIEYADIQMNESVINNVEMDIRCRIWRI